MPNDVDAYGRRLLTRREREAFKQETVCLDECRLSVRGRDVGGVWVDVAGRHNGRRFSVEGPPVVIRECGMWEREHEVMRDSHRYDAQRAGDTLRGQAREPG